MSSLQRTLINPGRVHAPVGRYSHLAQVRAGELLFLAGQAALDQSGKLVGPRDAGAQTRRAFLNIGKILESVRGLPAASPRQAPPT